MRTLHAVESIISRRRCASCTMGGPSHYTTVSHGNLDINLLVVPPPSHSHTFERQGLSVAYAGCSSFTSGKQDDKRDRRGFTTPEVQQDRLRESVGAGVPDNHFE